MDNTTHFISVFGRFTSSALRARNRIWIYWNLETLVASCLECPYKCGPNFVVWTWWCTFSWQWWFQWPSNLTFWKYRYYIVYIFEGAGLTGRRTNLIADVSYYSLRYALFFPPNTFTLPKKSIQYVLNVVFTSKLFFDLFSLRPGHSPIILQFPPLSTLTNGGVDPCFSPVAFSRVSVCSSSQASKQDSEDGLTKVEQMFGSLRTTRLQRKR